MKAAHDVRSPIKSKLTWERKIYDWSLCVDIC